MKCPVCGSHNPDSSDTCSVCGYDLTPYPSVLGGIPEGFLEKERRRVAAAKRVWEKSQAQVAAAERKAAKVQQRETTVKPRGVEPTRPVSRPSPSKHPPPSPKPESRETPSSSPRRRRNKRSWFLGVGLIFLSIGLTSVTARQLCVTQVVNQVDPADQELQSFDGHSNSVISANFSPDGTQVVSASIDGTVKLWQVSNGELIQSFEGHSHRVNSANFSPDGTQVVSASRDGTVKLWRVNRSNGKVVH